MKFCFVRWITIFWVWGAGVISAEEPARPAASPTEDKGAPSSSEALADYVRMATDSTSHRLEVKVATFTLPEGRTVDLFGVVHLADRAYYEEVDRRLATYDAVLFELVGDPAALQKRAAPAAADLPAARPHPLRGLQKGIGNLFKLEFQLEQVDYTKPNFVHADTTAGEFAKMQQDRGESMMKLLLKSLQLSGDPALQEKFREANNIGITDLVMLFYNEKSMQRVKLAFAKVLAESETFLAGGMLEKDNAIIEGRNAVALKKLQEVLTDPTKKRVAVFYGAGHMPTMEQDLIKDAKAVAAGEIWLSAWVMPGKVVRKP